MNCWVQANCAWNVWESYPLEGGKSFQNWMPAPRNPAQLAGGQHHLRPMIIALQPSHSDRETRVEVAAV